MQVDSQGRGLEHYARDSWRMTEQEKVFKNFYIITTFILEYNKTALYSVHL
jgi:hypothetical protein